MYVEREIFTDFPLAVQAPDGKMVFAAGGGHRIACTGIFWISVPPDVFEWGEYGTELSQRDTEFLLDADLLVSGAGTGRCGGFALCRRKDPVVKADRWASGRHD